MIACKTECGIEQEIECGTDVKVLITPWWGLIGVGVNWGSITEPLVVMVACIHSSEVSLLMLAPQYPTIIYRFTATERPLTHQSI